MELRNQKNEIMIFETKDKSVMLPVAVEKEIMVSVVMNCIL